MAEKLSLTELLKTMLEQGGSDLHISTNSPPRIRVDGKLKAMEGLAPMTAPETKQLAYSVLTDAMKHRFEENWELDTSFGLKGLARFRTNLFLQRGGVSAVYRVIPWGIKSFDELKLPPVVKELCDRPRGLILVTGPTGSGKSTTLAAMIDKINTERAEHIITIEDPIEFYHKHKKSTVNQREVGVDVTSFAEAIRRALRQDPDVILVGELRDLETIEAAITAAETGHVVFGTLHTSSAAGTINRIIDVFPPNQQEQIRTQLASAIIGILAQQLIPRIGGGRVAAFETLVVTPGIANLIRENKIFRITSAIQTGSKHGMKLLDDHLFELWKNEVVTKEDALSKANLPDELAKRIAEAERGIFEEAEEKEST